MASVCDRVRTDVYIGTDAVFGIGAACRPPAEWVSN